MASPRFFTRLGLLSPEAAATMQAWPVDRSGFRVHVETRVDPDDRDRLRTLLKYLTRCPVALERIHYVEQSGEVTLTTKKKATLNYRHALDLLADLSQHIRKRCLERVLPSLSPLRYGSIRILIQILGARSIKWQIPRP